MTFKKAMLITCVLLITFIFISCKYTFLSAHTDIITPAQPTHPQESCEDDTLIAGELLKISKNMYNPTANVTVAVEFTLD